MTPIFIVLLFVALFKSLVRSRLKFSWVIWNSSSISQATAIGNAQERMIRIVCERYIRRGHFYQSEILLRRFVVYKLAVRRQLKYFNIIYKFVHVTVKSMNRLRSIDFHDPLRGSRNLSTFYSYCMPPVSPLSQVQLTFNKKQRLDIFIRLRDSALVFRKQMFFLPKYGNEICVVFQQLMVVLAVLRALL